MTKEIRSSKSEVRKNPKFEFRSPKEIRKPRSESRRADSRALFGFRISGFLRGFGDSDFGFLSSFVIRYFSSPPSPTPRHHRGPPAASKPWPKTDHNDC